MNMKKVLFLCTGNSCRSQIAEAITNFYRKDKWQAYSAGTQIAEQIHPIAVTVLKEIDINHYGIPKSVNEFQDWDFDLVLTVCDQARESCPVWLGAGKKIHIGFLDPAAATGSDEEILSVFRTVRDQIIDHVLDILDNQEGS